MSLPVGAVIELIFCWRSAGGEIVIADIIGNSVMFKQGIV